MAFLDRLLLSYVRRITLWLGKMALQIRNILETVKVAENIIRLCTFQAHDKPVGRSKSKLCRECGDYNKFIFCYRAVLEVSLFNHTFADMIL